MADTPGFGFEKRPFQGVKKYRPTYAKTIIKKQFMVVKFNIRL